ncbi:MAG: hypothetical protein M3Q57_03145 [Pseudomonadota bacterium]|nr:hypothetical protein [Pseudomonadota bacterium]
MRNWAFMLGGLIVWAVQFFALYIIASVFMTTTLSRVLTAIITIACLAADGWLLRHALAKRAERADDIARWRATLAALAAALSLIAVAWQGLPALLT